jgi:two-component system sensor histidine kinase UhpB
LRRRPSHPARRGATVAASRCDPESSSTATGTTRPIDGTQVAKAPVSWPAVVELSGAAVAEASPNEPGRARTRHSLLRRLFLANAVVVIVAALLLIVTPVTISAPVTLHELALIVATVAAMLGATLVLLRRALSPLRELTTLMHTIDPLDPGRRLTGVAGSDVEVATLAEAFNAMLDRLEAERRSSARRALAAQEDERLRIARELHDEIGQSLTAIAMQAERAAQSAPAGDQATLAEIPEAIRRSVGDVRRIARRLRPEALDDLGLVNALISLCRRIGHQSGARIETDLATDLPTTSPETELVVYRIAQESLTNAVRHANASKITLSLAVVDEYLTLRVRDDGRGIDGPLANDTAGVNGMRERAMLVGGQLRIRSDRGAGTEVQLDLPLDGG